jgi:hypothetical protein
LLSYTTRRHPTSLHPSPLVAPPAHGLAVFSASPPAPPLQRTDPPHGGGGATTTAASKRVCSVKNPQMLVRIRIPKCKNAQIHMHLPVMTSSTEQRASPPAHHHTQKQGGMPQLAGPAAAADLHAPVMNSSKEPRASRTRPPARSSTPVRYPYSAAGCWMAAAVGKGGREGSDHGVRTW